jgi:hypothetical protein
MTDIEIQAALAVSRATSAVQAALWRPRNRKLFAVAKSAIRERDEALAAAKLPGYNLETLETHPIARRERGKA